jgi:uncharacterized membrane protein YuzA (DUF378 family)
MVLAGAGSHTHCQTRKSGDAYEAHECGDLDPAYRWWIELGPGLFSFDLVAAIFGSGSALARLVYILVGLSALWQLVPLTRAMSSDEPTAFRNPSAR